MNCEKYMNVIQIGVNRGSDHLTSIINNKDVDCLILVEPLDVHNEHIIKCYGDYKNYFLENIAISPTDDQDELQFYYHINDHPLFEVSSVNKQHILKHGYARYGVLDEEGIRTVTVKCLTLNNLFKKYNLKDIDILYIDAEGLDDVLIHSIDFEKYNINKIYFENIHINRDSMSSFLEAKGYTITHNVADYTSLAFK
jgi:hypothetical protein